MSSKGSNVAEVESGFGVRVADIRIVGYRRRFTTESSESWGAAGEDYAQSVQAALGWPVEGYSFYAYAEEQTPAGTWKQTWFCERSCD